MFAVLPTQCHVQCVCIHVLAGVSGHSLANIPFGVLLSPQSLIISSKF